MMGYIVSFILGYGMGCLNPAWFISRTKHINIHKCGTGNPGTTNAFMNLGKGWGCLVLIFDVLKAFLAVVICRQIFPSVPLMSIVAGCAAVMGHIFPFYLKFYGGKGIASFAGFILAEDWRLFIFLLVVGCIMALIFNYGCSISFSAAFLFPVLYAGKVHSMATFFLLAVCSGVITYRHKENILKIRSGQEIPIRTFLCRYIYRKG